MRTVGIREFRDQATALLASGETLVIERHGQPVGFFVPIIAHDREKGRAALGRLGDVIDEITNSAGIDEEDLVQGLTPRRRSA